MARRPEDEREDRSPTALTRVAHTTKGGKAAVVVTRSEIDGTDREAVFSALRSFDHAGVPSEAALRERMLELLDLSWSGLSTVATSAGQDGSLTADDLIRYYEEREQPACQLSPTVPSAERADEVMQNVFTFYGETHDLGERIDWEHNPGTAHWGHDLNRFGYLNQLVGAYLTTGDRSYGEKAVALILDWIANTDICDAFIPGRSPYVWRSYLNIHIHLGAWCEALERLLPDGFVSAEGLVAILKAVHDQLAYLEIVIPEADSNWVVFGATGMLKTALFFPELRDSERWIRYAWDRFEEQLDNQVLPDGVQFELTQHYHFGVARSYMTANCLTGRSGRTVPEKSRETLRKMVHYLHQTVLPDGRHLSFNDSDPNCGEGVAGFVTAEATLEACGQMSSRVTDGRSFEELPSEAFPCAGVYILRDRDLYMAFDGGPYGAHHQHEDKLSFWLAAYGRSLIVDPGRYLYDTSTPFRAYLLSTRAHNTLLVDGEGQSSHRHNDEYFSREPLGNAWESRADRVRVSAEYRLGFGEDGEIDVTHRRSVLFVPGRYWVLLDEVLGEGRHALESRFQFMPGGARIEGGWVRTEYEDANVLVCPEGGSGFDVRIESGQHDPLGGWYSDGYNLIEAAPQAAFTAEADLPFRVATLLLPYRGGDPPEVAFESVSDGYRVVVDGRETVHTMADVAVHFVRNEK